MALREAPLFLAFSCPTIIDPKMGILVYRENRIHPQKSRQSKF
jgi:hypothetical protein